MSSYSKRSLIFGISGQDGSILAKFLLDKGYEVIGTSRDASMLRFSNLTKLGISGNVHLVSANLSDFRSVLTVLKEFAPSEIYNLAGQSSVGLSFEQPVETFNSIALGNLNLLEALRFLDTDLRYYNAGSSECFGNTPVPASEKTPFSPRSPYATAKAAAFFQTANYREAYSLYACSGLLFNHESPLRPERFVTQKIITTACRIAHGSGEKLLLGNIHVIRDWGWAEEYIDAMWRMLQQPQADDFVIASGVSHSLQDFVEGVFAYLSLDWEAHVTFDRKLMRPSEISESRANPEKANNILDWQAKNSFADVIRLLVENYLEEHYS